MINGHVNGRHLDDQIFWPIFEAADALDVSIYLHPCLPPQVVIDALYGGFSPVVNSGLATGGWGWHVDTGLHVLRLILGRVFDGFPRLQLIIGHPGEALPAMIWRANTLSETSGLARPIQEYFTENVYVTTSGVFDYAPFAATVHALGSTDHILFSVDYPYSQNDEARRFLDGLPVCPADKEKIAHANTERLLRLGERQAAIPSR